MLNSGFGYKRLKDGTLVKKENNFGIKIGDNVEIGINTVIDRGSYRNTVIGDGTKIDNLTHVAHNVIIGKHCLITAGTIIGGSCEIGDYTHIGINSTIKDHVKIGKYCIVGCGSNVINDVEDYSIIAGNPAKKINSNLTAEQKFQMAYVQ